MIRLIFYKMKRSMFRNIMSSFIIDFEYYYFCNIDYKEDDVSLPKLTMIIMH